VRRALAAAACAALLAAAALTGCGDSRASDDGAGGARPRLVVFAASSLKDAFTRYAARFAPADVRLSFAGSDELAAQIRAGVVPDVYAAANTALPDALHGEGLVGDPVTFAANRLVIAVPAGEGAGAIDGAGMIAAIADLARPGVKLALGAPTVPIGAYAREVLARLPAGEERAILANVRSNEPDVTGIVGKLTQGAVDAGLVYVTDVTATHGALRAIALPAALQPRVAYGAAVATGARRPREARAFLAGLLRGHGAAALRAAGFEPPAAPLPR